LLVAPHGGRRSRASALDVDDPRKVNDLYTAELTLELAQRLQAAAIVNRGQDRNHLDLNRVSEVRARAPWLIDLLLDDVRRQIAAAGQATVLFIHGWNAIQPACDIGIGARVVAGALSPVRQGAPTIPPSFLPRLGRFAAACRTGSIDVTVGDRYPAAGRENVLQMLSARYADDPSPAIRELARLGAGGKIAAVQLELAIPLRWPGALRERLLDAVEALVDEGDGGADDAAIVALAGLEAPSSAATPIEGLSLEFHDGAAGIGGFVATERAATGRRHGRFLLCVGARRLTLFTGEDSSEKITVAAMRCAGLSWTRREAGEIHLAFDGPCLVFPRTDPFLDLENGLADAELSRLEVSLTWRPVALGARLGRIGGSVRYDGASATVSAPAALGRGRVAEAQPWRERRTLHVPLGGHTFLSIASRVDRDERVEGEVVCGAAVEPLLSGRVSVRNCADGLTPEAWRIEAVSRSGTRRVFGQVTHAIPVVRPTPSGAVLTHFGLARFADGERVGFGTFEQSQRLPQKGSRR
jgi:hypothetical protein